jgi:His-Xaa-Ser system protein HxsD
MAKSDDLEEQVCEICFSSEVYDLETVKKAAYRLSDKCTVDIDINADKIVCRLNHASGSSDISLAKIAELFRNEVLDQDLRRMIAEETAPMRNAILAYAFSRTGLQHGD